jgi:hypothetical protein
MYDKTVQRRLYITFPQFPFKYNELIIFKKLVLVRNTQKSKILQNYDIYYEHCRKYFYVFLQCLKVRFDKILEYDIVI